MRYTKTIVCLANSWKNTREADGRCVAGREVNQGRFGAWVRPVSSRSGHEISEQERAYNGGSEPEILDLIEIDLTAPHPKGHQQENHLIDPARRWKKVGRVSWTSLQSAVEDPGGTLWTNDRSSSKGLNDGVLEATAKGLGRSLYLVRPQRLVVTAGMESGYAGKPPRRRVRAQFRLGGIDYKFAVTDPVFTQALPNGETRLGEALLCLSLPAEAVGGFCYKLVATIITPERAGKGRG